jgi:hypothetical protein
MMNRSLKYPLPLLVVVVINYFAQIPYYFHQYYVGRHLAPSWPGTLLLLFTFLWFLAGYTRFIRGKKYGTGLLLSFLAAQVLFYGHAVVLGLINGSGVVAQLKTNSSFLLVIFCIGYLNFIVAAYYAYWLVKHKISSEIV